MSLQPSWKVWRSLLWCAAALYLPTISIARAQAVSPVIPTFSTTSRLVYLDVTVLDRKGNPVVSGLTKDDFTITENKQRKRIFSFEAPESHTVSSNANDDSQVGEAPLTIFVLDLLNSRFEDFAYIRFEVKKYLAVQPSRLNSPAELMVLGNDSLDMVQGFTRNKADLLDALEHVPNALPYKHMNGAFWAERLGQSIDALQQIALQNKGIPGRKNIIWVGHGAPGVFTNLLGDSIAGKLDQYVHDTTNMLVDARMTLFVIYPGLRVDGGTFNMSETSAQVDLGDTDPFAGDINFGVFVNETGGRLFYNRNDIDGEIKQSQEFGSEYYTLTYQPQIGEADGKFRRVRVNVRDPNLHKEAASDPRQNMMIDIAEAVRSTVPFSALRLRVEDVVRHPDTGTLEYTVVLRSKHLVWQSVADGKSTTNLTMAAASVANDGRILASKVEAIVLSANTQNPNWLAGAVGTIPIRLRVPRTTKYVRVAVMQNGEGGRLGSVELDKMTLKTAPEAPTPEPKLILRPPNQAPDSR